MSTKIGKKVADKIKKIFGSAMANVEGTDIPETLFKPQGDNNMAPKMTSKQLKARAKAKAAKKARKRQRG